MLRRKNVFLLKKTLGPFECRLGLHKNEREFVEYAILFFSTRP